MACGPEDVVLRPGRTEAGRWALQQSHRPVSMFPALLLGGTRPCCPRPQLQPSVHPSSVGKAGRASAGNLRLQMERYRQTSVFEPPSRDRHLNGVASTSSQALPSPQPSGPSYSLQGPAPCTQPRARCCRPPGVPILLPSRVPPGSASCVGAGCCGRRPAGLPGLMVPGSVPLPAVCALAQIFFLRTQCCTPRIGPSARREAHPG